MAETVRPYFFLKNHLAQGQTGEHAVGGEHHLDQAHLVILSMDRSVAGVRLR